MFTPELCLLAEQIDKLVNFVDQKPASVCTGIHSVQLLEVLMNYNGTLYIIACTACV